jgi:hypothetical protein
VLGEPLIVGAWPGPGLGGGGVDGAMIVMTKAGSDALEFPSLADTTMLPVSPTSDCGGMPVSSPVWLLNVAQVGLLTIENVS